MRLGMRDAVSATLAPGEPDNRKKIAGQAGERLLVSERQRMEGTASIRQRR